ncbi:MAG: BREX-1 system phosphatase PglZ type A [Deltaproteobacteria bacterium]|nr:BREX-1 system phosphatase PglZ type A [Deltaproteobacteria bacterium]
MKNLTQALTRLFDKHRIVFWYDTKKELRQDYEQMEIEGVEKIELKDNEFGLKYKILRENPEDKFLLYYEGTQPEDINNWLLDVQLYSGQFRADQAAIWLGELGLGFEFAEIVTSHMDFFQSGKEEHKRRLKFKELLKPEDTAGTMRTKLLAVCADSDPRVDAILETLLCELSQNKDEKIKFIKKCNLDQHLWKQLNRIYGYESKEPSIKDFVLELFKSCYAMAVDKEVKLNNDALVFLSRWKDSMTQKNAFEGLSKQCADILNIKVGLYQKDYRDLADIDYFEIIERKIIFDLIKAVCDCTISQGDCTLLVRRRKQSHWFDKYENEYEVIENTALFTKILSEINIDIETIDAGLECYVKNWFKLDQLYRKVIYHAGITKETTLLEPLLTQIEKQYTNNYLLKVNDHWQGLIDQIDHWLPTGVTRQDQFFKKWVQPYLEKGNKVFVIISDALRYEIGDELLSKIRQEDKYEATLKPMVSMLPSYTQLGMAALLPHKSLSLRADDTGYVDADNQGTAGIDARVKILKSSMTQSVTAMNSKNLFELNKDESRALFRDNDVVYIYHNFIDKTGDSRDSEDRVFKAVGDTIEEMIKLIKKLTAANASNILLTSDHGFIYQHQPVEESDFTDIEIDGEQVLYRNRRFVIGKNLKADPRLMKFSSHQLGLAGDVDVVFPKSINRLRLRGSGSRYVHGGASLQEIVIPVIHINKKRQSDVEYVEVEILKGTTTVISTGQLSVVFYQSTPVSDKTQPRKLRAGIYTMLGQLISDVHEINFDLVSERPREREMPVRFVLTKEADKANGQVVILRLEERETGTAHYREYKSVKYMVRRSFTSDFDF